MRDYDNEPLREIFHHTKIVITRKPHQCDICNRTIPKGTKCAKQYFMREGELPQGTYICSQTLLNPLACPFEPKTNEP
jgi:hypothetical protein